MPYRFGRRGFVLLLGLALVGCASTEQLAQRNNERCAARGFQPNTDAFNNCLLQLESERELRMDTRRRELNERTYIPPTN